MLKEKARDPRNSWDPSSFLRRLLFISEWKALAIILKNSIIKGGKQKCGSSGVLAHPGAYAGDQTTYTTAFGRAAHPIIRDFFAFYKVENTVSLVCLVCI